jgi:hypothetical protein
MKKIIIILILLTFAGCKTKTVLVPVDRVKVEYRDRLRVDSVYNSDTTYIRKSNDTVLIDVIRWRNKYILKTDSVVRTDSIPYPVEVVREVNKLTKWQRWRLNALNIIALVVVAYVVIKIRVL